MRTQAWRDARLSLLVLSGAIVLSGCQTAMYDRGKLANRAKPPVVTNAAYISENTQVIGQVQVLIARHEDTLPEIARRFDLGYEEITAANPGVDPWLPGEGTRIVLPTRFVLPNVEREGVVLNVASMRLFYFPKPAQGEPAVVITHPVGIGREGWATPLGRTRIVSKAEKPSWNVPVSVRKEHAEMGDPLPPVVPPGPDNPLGDHALRLAMPSYLIHGTNKPFGVGMRISHGCVRMYPEDIAALFPDIPVGTKVHIINQPYLVGRTRGSVELEVHKPLVEDTARFDTAYLVELLRSREDIQGIPLDGKRIAALLSDPAGVPAPIQRGAPTLDVVTSRARLVRNESPDPMRVSWLQKKKPQSTGEL